MDARLHPRGQKRLVISKADPRLIAVIDQELDSRVNLHTSSRRHCAALVRRRLEAMYPGDAICDVKATTLQTYINERDAGRYSFAKATTRRNTSNSPDREYFSGNSHRLGQVCEIDSTTLDVQVWDEKGNEFRPIVTALFSSQAEFRWRGQSTPIGRTGSITRCSWPERLSDAGLCLAHPRLRSRVQRRSPWS